MKRVSKFILGLVALVMGFGLMLQSCGGVTAAGLAAQVNEGCPKDLGDGVILQKVDSEGSWVVCHCSVPEDTNLDAISNAPQEAKMLMVQELKASDKDLFEGCAALGVGIKYVYQTPSGKATIELPAELFK